MCARRDPAARRPAGGARSGVTARRRGAGARPEEVARQQAGAEPRPEAAARRQGTGARSRLGCADKRAPRHERTGSGERNKDRWVAAAITDIVSSPMMIKTFFIIRERKARLHPFIFNNFSNFRVGGGTTGGEHAASSHDGTLSTVPSDTG